MKYLSLIGLLKAVNCFINDKAQEDITLLCTNCPLDDRTTPQTVCAQKNLKAFDLTARNIDSVRKRLQCLRSTGGPTKVGVGAWNGDYSRGLLLEIDAGSVTPIDPRNTSHYVLCSSDACPPKCDPCPPKPAPICQPAPICKPAPICAPKPICKPAPFCPPKCEPVFPPVQYCPPPYFPCDPCDPCEPFCDPCPPVCAPKKCEVKRKCHPCESPCVQNYPHRKVYVIDEISIFCKPYVRILETKCKPCYTDRVITISKSHSPFLPLPYPIPPVLREAQMLHRVLREARERFSCCGCVCLFIDRCGTIYVAVDQDYYKVLPKRRPCPPFPFPFPFPFQIPGDGIGGARIGLPFTRPWCPPFGERECEETCEEPCEEFEPKRRYDPCDPCDEYEPRRRYDPCDPCEPKRRYDPCDPCDPCDEYETRRPDICDPCEPFFPLGGRYREERYGRPKKPSHEFKFCKVKCKYMTKIRRLGLYAVLFARDIDCLF